MTFKIEKFNLKRIVLITLLVFYFVGGFVAFYKLRNPLVNINYYFSFYLDLLIDSLLNSLNIVNKWK